MPNQVSFGDVIQFGAALGLTLCPGEPVVPFFTRHTNATAANISPESNNNLTLTSGLGHVVDCEIYSSIFFSYLLLF